MKLRLTVLITALTLAHVHMTSAATGATRLQCDNGRNSCSECYIRLVECLMYNDENVLNLTTAFLPPTELPPVFVKVDYQFVGGEEPKTWYWTSDTSTLLHPLDGSQYFSLLFGNYEIFRTGEVTVTLPSNCSNASQEFYESLTQRLKLHASQLRTTPFFSDSDDANSADVELVENTLHTTRLVTILYFYQIFIPWLLAIGAGAIIYTRIEIFLPETRDEKIASIFSLTVVAFLILVYAVVLDGFGIHFSSKDSVPKYSDDEGDQSTVALYFLPLVMLTTYDSACLLVFLGGLGIYFCSDKGKKWTMKWIASVPLFAVTFVLANHSYYIIVAFINDPVHANSIGIYYFITVIVFLVVLKWLFVTSKVSDPIPRSNVLPEILGCCDKFCKIIGLFFAISLMVLFQVLITATFVYIPIKRAIIEVPAQINSIYQSLIVVFGALITYQLFIKKDASLESITKNALVSSGKVKLAEDDKKKTVGNKEVDLSEEELAQKFVQKYLNNYFEKEAGLAQI